MAQLAVPVSGRYSSHAFRRGASHGPNETGPPWSAVASSGLWRSPAFRGYVDMSRDVGTGARQHFDVDIDSLSDGE